MANKITQRLIAAGASPQRAQAFATQFAKSMPGKRPQDIQDAFDAELAALSQAFFPNTFRPPTPEDPRFLDYAVGVYGEDQIRKVISDAFAKNAPTFTAAKVGAPYEQKIANDIASGKSIVQIQAQILQDYEAQNADLLAFPAVKTTDDAITAASNYAGKLFNEYKKAEGLSLGSVKNFFNTNKYYKSQLPDPKLKYGKEEDLSAGVISWKTHPQVDAYLKKPEVASKIAMVKAQRTAPAAGYIAAAGPQAIEQFKATRATPDVEDTLFEEFASSKANPFKDEVIRRESLKKKTLK
jgi:hypothetical protein